MTTALIEPIKPRINGSYYHCYNFLLDELPGQIHLKHNLVVCTTFLPRGENNIQETKNYTMFPC